MTFAAKSGAIRTINNQVTMNFRKLPFFVFTLILVFPLEIQAQEIDRNMLLKSVEILAHDSLEGRGFATEGNYKAQRFIANQFEALGIDPAFGDSYQQKFTYTLTGRRRQRMFPIDAPKSDFSNVPDTTLNGANLAAMIKGQTDKIIVITGHLDHLGIRNGEIYNGADDDASGTAALFAIAEYFKSNTPEHTLVFAAVDGEEIGSPGCKFLLQNFPLDDNNIVLNVNMDMIAHNDNNELYASGL